MLETVKSYISETNNVPFDEFYQRYICYIQDVNIQAEISSIKPDDITSLSALIQGVRII